LRLLLVQFVPYYAFFLMPRIRGAILDGAVLLYLLISCVAMAAAIGLRLAGRAKGLYVAGIGLILFSDTLISLNGFLSYSKLNWLILPTYYLAHLVITLSILARFGPPSAAK